MYFVAILDSGPRCYECTDPVKFEECAIGRYKFNNGKCYSPVILWKKIGEPATNCKRRFLNGFRLCNVSLLTYQKSQRIPLREVTKKRDLL